MAQSTDRTSRRRHGRGIARAAILALLLIAAESYAAWHAADFDAHAAEAGCKICLAVSAFAGANVATTDAGAVAAMAPGGAPPAASAPATRDLVPHCARGPPILS